MKKKTIALALVLVMVFGATLGGTFAYLTSTDTVTNTFTVGNVKIKLDETDVDINGVKDGSTRVKENSYKLMPGHSYIKDPVVHVDATSEPCYIRTIVTVNSISKLKDAFPKDKYADYYSGEIFLLEKLVSGWTAANWACVNTAPDGTYEFRYVGAGTDTKGVYTYTDANKDLPALFETIEIPGTVDADHLAKLQDVKITVVAHAIQADGFTGPADAWSKF